MQQGEKEEIEKKKEFLRSYNRAKIEKKRLGYRLAEIRATCEYPKSITISDMPKAKDRLADLSDYVVKYEAALIKALEANDRQMELLQRIEHQIDEITEPEEKMVLELKYIQGMEWEEIAKEMGMSRSTATRIHGKALLELQI